jgi:uncharacterized glyoxalase superfamily protein PhnB
MTDVKPVPEGYPHVSPSLTFDGDGCSAAIDFYTKVLGATERMRMPRAGSAHPQQASERPARTRRLRAILLT